MEGFGDHGDGDRFYTWTRGQVDTILTHVSQMKKNHWDEFYFYLIQVKFQWKVKIFSCQNKS